jgi:hypothetical protein
MKNIGDLVANLLLKKKLPDTQSIITDPLEKRSEDDAFLQRL